ncbi:acyl-CoA dehydrogenase family protein [Gordonia iterans]
MTSKTASKDTNSVGSEQHKRSPIGAAMRVLTAVTGSEFADKYKLREPLNRVAYEATKTGFKSLGAANRAFTQKPGGGDPQRPAVQPKGYFNLNPDEEQAMIAETVRDFATEILRPAAYDADNAASAPAEILGRSAELGITMINVPEAFDGAASDRGVVTNALVAEAMAYGDMGLAVPLLAPSGVATTLTNFGSDAQQQTYLPDFAGESVPISAVVVAEPWPLFDAFNLRTKATRVPSGYRLDGVKSFVPNAGDAELFLVGAMLDGRPALFIVESDTQGLSVEADPGMGLRAAGMGRLILDKVSVPAHAILGVEPGAGSGASGPNDAADSAVDAYSDVVRLSRLGWSALAAGTGKAVLDYVVPYVNEREAFGEPISNRQAVAFMVATMATEVDSIRLVTLRGASRAEQGLSFAREAALARKLTIDKGLQIGLDGIQLLGGHGFTKEHPVERWYRDLRGAGIGEGVVVL